MEELEPTEKETNDSENAGANRWPANSLPKNLLDTWVRRVIFFICYGPGVFGFLWLIGRFLKR